jgi:hypothetical protein
MLNHYQGANRGAQDANEKWHCAFAERIDHSDFKATSRMSALPMLPNNSKFTRSLSLK